MPHLEEQFPPINPLVLLRPDALDPPDREEEEETRPVENRIEDEAPIPGSLANGIDRVTISANARVIVPVQPLEETVPLPIDLIPGENVVNPATPNLLNLETQRREIGTPDRTVIETPAISTLQNFANRLEENRASNEAATLPDRNPAEPPNAPGLNPAIPLVQNAERETREQTTARIENSIASEPPPVPIAAPEAPPVAEIELEQDNQAAPRNENRFVPVALPPRGPFSVGTDDGAIPEPAEDAPAENTVGLRGNTPVPRTEGRVNVLTPPNVGEDPPGPNIQETRNFGEGRALSLDLETAGNENSFISLATVDQVLEEAGAIPRPGTSEPQAEIVPPPAAPLGVNVAPATAEVTANAQDTDFSPVLPDLRVAQRDPADNPGPVAPGTAVSSLIDSRQVLEEDQETQAVQPPAFPELDPDEPFVRNLELEAREEDIPAVDQAPLNVSPPAFENAVPVAPPVPGNVEVLNENPQALRRNNLGTDPALRSNRELRNFLQEFNNRIESPEEVTEAAGGPVTEVQNNAPPPPAVFENLEAVSAELLNDLREQETTEGVTRPEEERAAPPEPRTPEFLLTERGQNIDRFI